MQKRGWFWLQPWFFPQNPKVSCSRRGAVGWTSQGDSHGWSLHLILVGIFSKCIHILRAVLVIRRNRINFYFKMFPFEIIVYFRKIEIILTVFLHTLHLALMFNIIIEQLLKVKNILSQYSQLIFRAHLNSPSSTHFLSSVHVVLIFPQAPPVCIISSLFLLHSWPWYFLKIIFIL